MAQPILEEDVPRFDPSGSVVERRQAAAQHSVSQAVSEGILPEESAVVIPPDVEETEGFDEFDVPHDGFEDIEAGVVVTAGTGSGVADNRFALDAGSLEEVSLDFALPYSEIVSGVKDTISSGVNIDQISTQILRTYLDDYTSTLLEDATAEELPAVVGHLAQQQDKGTSPEQVMEQAISLLSETDSLREQDVVVDKYASYLLHQYISNSGSEYLLDVVGDVASAIAFLPVQSLALQDVTGSFWEGEDRMEEIQSVWRGMTPEDQIKILPGLIKYVDEATGGDKAQTNNVVDLITGSRDVQSENKLEMGMLGVEAVASLLIAGAPLKVWRSIGSKRAGEANVAALMDDSGRTAEVLETTQMNAAVDALPFNMEALTRAQTDGIAGDHVNTLTEELAKINFTLKKAEEGLIDRPMWDKVEQTAAEERILSEYNNSSKFAADSAIITERTPTGFTIQYEIKSFGGQTKTREFFYTEDDIERGAVFAKGNPVRNAFNSPEVIIEPQLPGAVTAATLADQTSGIINEGLTKAVNLAYKGLNKQSKQKIEDVMYYGDEVGDANLSDSYTLKQLIEEGVPTVNGKVYLNEKEIRAYYGIRMVKNEEHRLLDKAYANQLRFQGFQHVPVRSNGKLRPGFGKPLNEIPNVKKIYNGITRQGEPITPALRKSVEEGQLVPVRFKQDVNLDDGLYQYGLMPKKNLRPIQDGDQVLNKPKHYMSRYRKNAFYFVRSHRPTQMKNGAPDVNHTQAERYFDNNTDAEVWAAQETDRTGILHQAHPDRAFTSPELENHQLLSIGGSIGSARSSRDILLGLEGAATERVSMTEALQRSIQQTANIVPMNSIRMDMQARWMKSADPFLKTPGDFNSEFDFTKIIQGSAEHLDAVASRDYIKDIMRIPTDSEATYARTIERVAQWMEGKVYIPDGVRKSILNISQKDPFGAMRAAAFHPLLGWFNPAQLLVQAQSAAVAISLNPELFPRIFPRYMAMRAAAFTNGSDEVLRRTAKVFLQDPDDFIHTFRAFEQTGFRQSLRSNADFDAASQGFGVDKGSVRRTADAGLWAFREGELFGRMYSWLWAREDMIKKGAVARGTAISMKAVDKISEDAIKHMLNLNRTNRARWQKGLWSVPTQFQQINAKVLENFAPEYLGIGSTKKFTAKDKAKVWAGQFALYGAAGVPLGNHIAASIIAAAGEEGNIDPTNLAGITDGLSGIVQQEMFGTIIQGSDRLAFAQGMNDVIAVGMDGQMPKFSSLFGPFGAIGERTAGSAEYYWNSFIGPSHWNSEEYTVTPAKLATLPVPVLEIISTFSNLHKAAIMLAYNKVITSNGETLMFIDNEGSDLWMTVGKALGLQPKEIDNHYTLAKYVKAKKQRQKDALRGMKQLYSRFLGEGDTSKEAYDNLMFNVKLTMLDMDEVEQEEVWGSFSKLIQDPMSKERKLMNEASQLWLESGASMERAGSVEPSLLPQFQYRNEE